MIIKEFYRTRNDGVKLYRTYSNDNKQIRKIGTDEIYEEAIDVADALFVYEETDVPINDVSNEDTI
jgi:hypothetical protein